MSLKVMSGKTSMGMRSVARETSEETMEMEMRLCILSVDGGWRMGVGEWNIHLACLGKDGERF